MTGPATEGEGGSAGGGAGEGVAEPVLVALLVPAGVTEELLVPAGVTEELGVGDGVPVLDALGSKQDMTDSGVDALPGVQGG